MGGSDDRTLRIWDLGTLACLATLEGHMGPVIAVSADYAEGGPVLVVSGSYDGSLRVWGPTGDVGPCLCAMEGHSKAVLSVCVDFGNAFALSGSYDGTLRLWDLTTCSCLGAMEGH